LTQTAQLRTRIVTPKTTSRPKRKSPAHRARDSHASKTLGAIEGTRTPTPLRVHGPEPCASANSATMASGLTLQRRPDRPPNLGRPTTSFYRHAAECQTARRPERLEAEALPTPASHSS